MNRKINTICFIFLFFFLICAVSAADNENETLKTISPDLNDHQAMSSACDSEVIQVKNVENPKQNLAKSENPINTKVTRQKVSLNAADVNMYYKDGHKFSVTAKDKNRRPIAKINLKITIDGKSYSRVTDSKGTASLYLNLKSGKYVVLTVFDGTNAYEKASIKNTVTIKSTVKCSDFTKYYKNTAQYSATFFDQRGNILKNTPVKFQIRADTYTVKTDKKGEAKLRIDLKPSKADIIVINTQTTEKVTKKITIKSLIQTSDLTMDEGDGANFNVKIMDSNGKASAGKRVTLKLNGQTYIENTDNAGQIKLPINLKAGTYTITTEFDGCRANNRITVDEVCKTTSFKHVTMIPNYVNVTLPYVYPNAKYSLETGANGIVKMPKIEVFTVEIGNNVYQYATGKTNIGDVLTMEQKSYLTPFNGCLVSCSDKNLLTYDGLMLTRTSDSTEIEFRSKTNDSVEVFGFYANKGAQNSEVLTYMQNERMVAKVTIQTQYFDETGVKYSLAKYYNRVNLDFPYYEITNHVKNPIRFTNTGQPVTFSYFETSIVGYCSCEEIITKFIINGKEEIEKKETISYGLNEKYRKTLGFEVLQAYSIIAKKISQKTLEDWISYYSNYSDKYGVRNVYGMHLACLETVWLADMLADNYAKDFNVEWKRNSIITILGGINLEDTYLHIPNADMGMKVTGNSKNTVSFRLMNSINLPNLEDYTLSVIAKRYWDNTTNSLTNVITSIENNEFSIAQLGNIVYVFSQDGSKSAIALDSTTGVASVIVSNNDAVYKGSSIPTTCDCCSIGIIPLDMIAGIRDSIKILSPSTYFLTDNLTKIYPSSVLAYLGIKKALELTLKGASSACMGLFSTMSIIQAGGTVYRDKMVDNEKWHQIMDTYTFTRPGYLQGKKIYNIPNKKGGHDYIEVKINDDLTLDRNNAIYISDGKTKKLTKSETYAYFCEDYWSPISVPTKYWDESWKGS